MLSTEWLCFDRGVTKFSYSASALIVFMAGSAMAQLPVLFGTTDDSNDLPGTTADIVVASNATSFNPLLGQVWVSPNGLYMATKANTSLGAETLILYDLAQGTAVTFAEEGMALPASLPGTTLVEVEDLGSPSNTGLTSFSYSDDSDDEEVEVSAIATYDPVSGSYTSIAATGDDITNTDFVFGSTTSSQEFHGELISSPHTTGDGAVIFIDEFTLPFGGLRERNLVPKRMNDEFLFLKTGSSLNVVATADGSPSSYPILTNSFANGGALFPVPSDIRPFQTFNASDAFARGDLATWAGSERADGTRPFMFKGFTNTNLNQDEVIVVASFDASAVNAPSGATGVTYDVVYEESVPLPFSAFSLIPPNFDGVDGGSIFYMMDDEGDWGLIGEFDLLSGDVPFAFYNGTVITQVDVPIFFPPQVTGPVWTDLDYITPQNGTDLFAILGDIDEIPEAQDSSRGTVLFYDGEIVLEAGDTVDVDGNGAADAEIVNMQRAAVAFGVNSTIYVVATVSELGGGSVIGEVLVQLGCPADFDGDGDSDSTDLQSFILLLGGGDIDIDGNGAGDAFDLSIYSQFVTRGCP